MSIEPYSVPSDVRMRNLEAEVEMLRGKIRDTEEILDLLRLNGLEDVLTGHGYQRFGGGKLRLGPYGYEQLSASGQVQRLWLVSEFANADPALQNSPTGSLFGVHSAGTGVVRLTASRDQATDAEPVYVNLRSTSTLGRVQLVASIAGTSVEAGLRVDGTNRYFELTNVTQLLLAGTTSDPTAAGDGALFYRSDTDKVRARVNGAWVNLAAEGALVLGDGSELTIASGAITITNGYHTVDTESDAASDDLVTINGGAAGQVLVIRPESSVRDVVVLQTGNISLTTDYTMNHADDTLTLIYNGSTWLELARSSNA